MNLIDKNSIQFGRYDHFKGMPYELLDVVYHSETQESMVLYRALYGEKQLWVRPFEMFFESVDRGGKVQPRFLYVGE
ncbi:MAG TPA: DUF1653 domain-containing protein [Gammaproteobacteria bacterium]|nr:DUF1653 domain-containing protein [Gammaproteobacteria bacterium]|tara:strand:- start:248 stop:478 length:231 start_codon:yes stop_codon:yes gene_type:complete